MIKNFDLLANTKMERKALQILESGLMAAQPKNFLKKSVYQNYILLGKNRIVLSKYRKIFVVAYGKAASSMAEYVVKKINISKGIVVIPKNTKSSLISKKFVIIHAGHPIPDRESVKAGKIVQKFVESCSKEDFILFLVSGGGSSLLSLPDKITLNEKKQVTKLLLKSGATIDEFNSVRKHLSRIKGGKLVKNMQSDGCALIMSDVLTNNLSVISSGCTYNDNTTFSDAIKVITKYSLTKKLPKKVITHLKHGLRTQVTRPNRLKVKNKIIATNLDCLNTMAIKAKSLGISTKIYSSVNGDVSTSAQKIVKMMKSSRKSCIIFGGESTVHVKGNGKGGRNQELVLQILKRIQNLDQNVLISSISTDGIDGNTNYSGALIKNHSINLQKISLYLKNNDSNSFFKKYGGLIKTGPTNTNLMDIGLIIKY
jgi:hydroxypyruvate reductase